MKIKISRCSCRCGGKWALFEVQPHGAEISMGCLCHSIIPDDVELVNSATELLEILQTILWDFNKMSETSRQLLDDLDARLLKVEQKTDTNIIHDEPEHSSMSKVARDIRGKGEALTAFGESVR